MMHHGSGSQNIQRPLQRSKSYTGNEGDDQTPLPQSPATAFGPALSPVPRTVASPSGPQSPNYQLQQLIMNRSPVSAQNVNITLQNVSQVMAGSQQITLAPLPIQNPASPGFQYSSQAVGQQRRFDHGSPSYIQVTSPLPQVQPQSPTQHSPATLVQSVQRPGTAAPGLGMCNQSPTRGFVDANVLVRQLNLSPSSAGHFVYQDPSSLTQITSNVGGQIQLTTVGTSASVPRERRLSQPHSQTGGTIHHLGPQSPAASGAMQPLPSPSHITTSNLPPQISSIIQGQLIQQQQQQVLHSQQIARPVNYERTSVALTTGVGGPSVFGITSPTPPSPSRNTVTQTLASTCLTPSSSCIPFVRKQPKKLEEIPPATPEISHLRKQCLEHHFAEMETLRETFKDYLIELFFLQHRQGNMMDYLAFRRKPCLALLAYLKQNDLDLEEEEEEEQSEVINDEVKVVTGKDGQTGTPVAIATQLPPNVSAAFSTQQQQQFQQTHQGTPVAGTANTVEIEAFKRQQALSQTGGMPPTPQTIQLGGQKQNQQQYDPSKGPPVQNAASLHTPPPQLPGRLQPTVMPLTSLPATIQLTQQHVVETQLQPLPQLHTQPLLQPQPQPQNLPQIKAQQQPVSLSQSQTQLQVQLQQQVQAPLHVPMQTQPSAQLQSQAHLPQQQTVTLMRSTSDSGQACQRLIANSLPTSSMPQVTHSGTISSAPVHQALTNRTPLAAGRPVSPISQSKQMGLVSLSVTVPPKAQVVLQNSSLVSQDSTTNAKDKVVEQVKQENQIHQRIAELRKEGLWSLRRLPRLQEAPRPKSHWDYLLEEMQWMAADFAQERRWKMGIAKKLARTVVRHHEEQKLNEERARREEHAKLRRKAAAVARDVLQFWCNIEKVVEVKLQLYMEEQRRKALHLRRESSNRGPNSVSPWPKSEKPNDDTLGNESNRKSSDSFAGDEAAMETVEDCEETIEEQEAIEGIVDHQTELADLAKQAEIPLEDLVRQYAGAYSENFDWPAPDSSDSEDDDYEDVEEMAEEFDAEFDSPEQEVAIDSLLSVDQYRVVERVHTNPAEGRRPRKDIAEVSAAAEPILPKGTARYASSVRNAAPFLLRGTLREYQQIGIDWLAGLHRRKLNGILADDSRLGKTVQIIGFLAHLAANEGIWGPHLVVVRTCKMLNWEMEFKRWCPGLKIMMYFGTRKERRVKRERWLEPKTFHVCITSYKLLLKDHQAFRRKRWKYLILDEVQQLRNTTERHWEALFNLKSQQRLLLIGAPLQNTPMELWTMMHFLLPGISRSYLDFPVKVGTDENQDYCHKLVIRMHRMIQPFILRRSKRDVEKQLPKKYEHILKCCLSKRQKIMYEDVMYQPATMEALRSRHFVSVLNLLMQLRRICNHPNLKCPRSVCSAYVFKALQYTVASVVLKVLEYDPWKNVDLSAFNLTGIENRLSRYETEMVMPKRKVTRKLIEEIYYSPDLPPRPRPVKVKVSKLFQPVQYGQKPDDRTVVVVGTQPQRAPSTTSAATHQGQSRGKSSAVAVPASQVMTSAQGGEVVSIAQLASIAGGQGRGTQTSQPVTLHFQGNKFTLSSSQLRQLTAGQHLQLQGNVLQIVSAPGQQIMRQQSQTLMQAQSQGNAVQNASAATGNQQGIVPSSVSTPVSTQASFLTTRTVSSSASGEQGAILRPISSLGSAAQDSIEEKKKFIKERLDRIFLINEKRCSVMPVYGTELLGVCFLIGEYKLTKPKPAENSWLFSGYVNCCNIQQSVSDSFAEISWKRTESLSQAILSTDQRQDSMQDIIKRVQCVVPHVVATPPVLYTFNPPPSYTHHMRLFKSNLKQELAPYAQQLLQVTSTTKLLLTDPRLIQFDSGKLEALAVLLHKLKSERRRVLIFTQMVQMLDILESFLDYHSFAFVRIDSNVHLNQRQVLMKLFNTDKRIFCAILSTRGGATGVNLVDADTVIVYDSDLNPTLDSQVQEWCDRIGKCKDIHIYRLVIGNSIEEKLLKNGTKNMIRDVASHGSNYCTAYLQQQTVRDLFEIPAFMGETASKLKTEEFVVLSQVPSLANQISPKETKPFLEALNSIEQETGDHARSGQTARSELREGTGNSLEQRRCTNTEESAYLDELAALVEQLTPVEKYAMNYLELTQAFITPAEQKLPDDRIKTAKRVWEFGHLHSLKEEKKRQLEDEENDVLFTYSREDAYNKEYVKEGQDGQTEIMPIWTPPTPPQDDNDIYMDPVMCLLYDTTPILESKLPPVYVRKEHKRLKLDPTAAGKKFKKARHGEPVTPPRSLFDRSTPCMLKMRREAKDQKKNMFMKQQTSFAKPLPTLTKPPVDSGTDSPEWLISEDWALLQAVKQLLELPLNLTIISPAHTPNWDLVSDVVNSCSRIYRSPKQCRNRYENVIIPREEGKLIYDTNPKKKTKSIYKNKNSRPLRTSQIYAQDESVMHTQLFTSHFELVKLIAGKRSPPIKPMLGMNPFQKNPKHASVLAESGINYDKPLPPIQVATLRAERISKEKKALAEQQRAQQLAQQQQQAQQNTQPAVQQQQGSQAQTPVLQQSQVVVQTATSTVTNTTVLQAGAIKTAAGTTSIQTATVGGNVIVNTAAGVQQSAFQPINKRLTPHVISGTLTSAGGTTAQVVHAQQRTVATSAATTEVVAIATNQGVRAAMAPVTATAAAVVTTNLTPVQSQTRPLVTQVTPATGIQLTTGKPISQAQIQLFRQPQTAPVQVQQIQPQSQTSAQLKTVQKLPDQLIKLKQKQQQQQQLAQVTQRNTVLGGAVTSLPVARIARVSTSQLQAQGQIQTQPVQTAQVTLTKPPVVSVPTAVVSSGVTTLPVTVAGISVAISQPQKGSAGGQTVVKTAIPQHFSQMHVQQLLKLKQQKAGQAQVTQGQAAVQAAAITAQQKITQQVTVQSQQQQQQKVTYTTAQLQSGMKPQFLSAQAQKPTGTQQMQTQIQDSSSSADTSSVFVARLFNKQSGFNRLVAKLPQMVQQQATVGSIQQMVSTAQQVQTQPQTMTLSQAATGQQVQVIPAAATAQVVQQQLIQQQVVTAASPQIQPPTPQSPAQPAATPDAQGQQAKVQARTAPTVRLKAPTKPN